MKFWMTFGALIAMGSASAMAVDVIAPGVAQMQNIPHLVFSGWDSPSTPVDQQIVNCQKKFETALANLVSRGFVIVEKRDCTTSGNVTGEISFIR